jgi:hypothetical protein
MNADDLRAERPLNPLAADGVVTVDREHYELIVRPAPDARAYARVLWDEGVRDHLQTDYYSSTGPATVWASGAGESQIAYGMPARDGAMRFRFHDEHPAYRKLVSTPGLRARIFVDRGGRGILSVTFRGRDR